LFFVKKNHLVFEKPVSYKLVCGNEQNCGRAPTHNSKFVALALESCPSCISSLYNRLSGEPRGNPHK
jgi:hypothetical protein